MADFGRGPIGGDEDRLPWLEPVESDEPEPAIGAGKLIAAVIVALLAIGLVIGGLFWVRQRNQPTLAEGSGDIIPAPEGPYKIVPKDPGGMDVPGEGDATFAASQGNAVDAAIDISRLPEAPLAGNARPGAPATPPASAESAAPAPVVAPKPVAPEAKPAVVAAKPVVVAPKPAPAPAKPEVAKLEAARSGPAVQLGAFGSEAKAQAAWADLARRFPGMRSLSHSVTLAEVNGKKLYRLRASAGSEAKASSVCRALSSAKEACAVIG